MSTEEKKPVRTIRNFAAGAAILAQHYTREVRTVGGGPGRVVMHATDAAVSPETYTELLALGWEQVEIGRFPGYDLRADWVWREA